MIYPQILDIRCPLLVLNTTWRIIYYRTISAMHHALLHLAPFPFSFYIFMTPPHYLCYVVDSWLVVDR